MTGTEAVRATSAVGLTGLAGAAGATPSGSDRERPVRARGKIQLVYEHAPDTPVVEQRFVSPDLDRRVGTESQWATVIESRRQSGDVSISSEYDYSGPIWEYDKNDDGYYTKTAPINVVWETEYADLDDVVSRLEEGELHGLGSCAHTKYAYVSYHGFVSQDAQVGTQDYYGDAQYHVRTWKDRGYFGSYDGQFEIGSAHHDPAGHNFGCCCDSFDFEEAEDYVQDYWRNDAYAKVGLIYLDNAKDWSSDCKESNGAYGACIDWY
jgi:hypothetical protein